MFRLCGANSWHVQLDDYSKIKLLLKEDDIVALKVLLSVTITNLLLAYTPDISIN